MGEDKLEQAKEAFEQASSEENHVEMVRALDTIITLDSKSATAYLNRGKAYSALGNPARAFEDYKQAIALEPDNPESYLYRGLAYIQLGMNEAAIDDFSEVIRLDPSNGQGYYNRGYVYFVLSQFQHAIDDFTKAVEADPDFTAAWGNRGNCFDALGQYEKAIEDFDRAIVTDATHVFSYFNRANEFLKLGEYEMAIKDYSSALELSPNDAHILQNRARARSEGGFLQEALDDYSELVRLDPIGVDNVFEARAQVFEKLGKPDLAKADRLSAQKAAVMTKEFAQQAASDDALLRMLRDRGCSLKLARDIDHSFACPANKAKQLVERLERLGHRVDAPRMPGFSFLSSSKVSIESHEHAAPSEMLQRTWQMVRIASEFGASYDGWGTGGV